MRTLLFRSLLAPLATTAAPPPGDAALEELGRSLAQRARRVYGRSLAIREVDAGSCNGCELEIHALGNAFYDLERFGLRFVASPRHADVLLVTGPVTSYAVIGAVDKVIPVDLHIRGCPPTPTALLEGLIALVDKASAGSQG